MMSFAGFRSSRAVPLYLGSRFFCLIAFAAAFAIAGKIRGLDALFGLAAMGAAVGYAAPAYYIKRRTNKRFIAIRKSLPDVLDTIITCVEAGLGLNAAMDRVADERMKVRNDVMGGELKYMTYEMQAGVPREQAFHNLGERNGVDDLQSLAAFMVQSEKLGTGLTEALKIYASELRTKRRQRAQEQANKAAVKLLFPLVFFIFPTMFLVILGPAIMKFKASFATIGK
jgi:tight adherence protein C